MNHQRIQELLAKPGKDYTIEETVEALELLKESYQELDALWVKIVQKHKRVLMPR